MALPTYLVFGDKDGKNTTGARQVIQALSAKRIPCKYRVIKGGGHSAPYGNQDWWQEALPFVTGVSFEPEDGDAREPGQ